MLLQREQIEYLSLFDEVVTSMTLIQPNEITYEKSWLTETLSDNVKFGCS